MKPKKYYAKYDWMTSARNPGHGFSNSEDVKVFFSKKERDEFVENRNWFDFSCRVIFRDEALKMADSYDGRKYIPHPTNEHEMVFI